MKKIVAVLLLSVLLSGCGGVVESVVDPSGYTQRETAKSDALRSQSEAEAEHSRSEAQRAQADSEARQEEAQAAFATAATNAVKEAAAQNRTAVLFGMILIAALAGWSIWNMKQVTVAATMASAQQQLLPPPPQVKLIPPQVKLIAEERGYTVSIAQDGRWLLLDDEGNVRMRQKQNQLTG